MSSSNEQLLLSSEIGKSLTVEELVEKGICRWKCHVCGPPTHTPETPQNCDIYKRIEIRDNGVPKKKEDEEEKERCALNVDISERGPAVKLEARGLFSMRYELRLLEEHWCLL